MINKFNLSLSWLWYSWIFHVLTTGKARSPNVSNGKPLRISGVGISTGQMSFITQMINVTTTASMNSKQT